MQLRKEAVAYSGESIKEICKDWDVWIMDDRASPALEAVSKPTQFKPLWLRFKQRLGGLKRLISTTAMSDATHTMVGVSETSFVTTSSLIASKKTAIHASSARGSSLSTDELRIRKLRTQHLTPNT